MANENLITEKEKYLRIRITFLILQSQNRGVVSSTL